MPCSRRPSVLPASAARHFRLCVTWNEKMEEAAEPCLVEKKMNRISQLLGELMPERFENKENTIASDLSASGSSLPRSSEALYERLVSFAPGHWGVREVSPLDCARYGWKVIQPDVMQCVTCRQVVCSTLPLLADKQAYNQFLEKLKKQVVDGHHEACWWRYNPCSQHLARPLQPATLEDLRTLANAAHKLEGLESSLPQIDIPVLMAKLGADDELVQKLYSTPNISALQTTAALLVLSGWSKGAGAYLRCNKCCRSVGLWSFMAQTDGEKPDHHSMKSPQIQEHTSGKRKARELEGLGDESGILSSQERHSEPEDTKSSWRMRLRERRVSEQSTPEEPSPRERRASERSRKSSTTSQTDAREELASPLDTAASPPTQTEKIEKQFLHPLDEHRPWCPWITDDGETKMKGYQKTLSSVKDVLKKSERNGSLSSRKFDGNVQGVRLVHNLLDNLGIEELHWQ